MNEADGARRRPTSHHLITAALEAAANGIVLTDAAGRIVWVNPAVTRMTGFEREELIGQTPRILRSGVHPHEFYADLWSTILAGRVWQGDMVNRHKGGDTYHETMTITPVTNARGKITHFIAVKEDVTEKRRMEAQLAQSQRMESIGRLAGGIAHDFNNLLGAMLGYAELTLSQLDPESPVRDDVSEIIASGNRAAALVRQILAFARPQPSESTQIDLNLLVGEVSRLLRRAMGDDVELVMVPAERPAMVDVDTGQLEQVLLNLAVNARDAMPNGGVLRIEISHTVLPPLLAEERGIGREVILLRVSDTGLGMPAEVRRHAFEPFFTTKEPGRGTGLGLATCYGIVNRAGGFIDLTSEPGQGTSFGVYLPRSTSTSPPLREPEAVRGARAPRTASVLLVEDHDSLRRLLTRTLSGAGYTVLAAAHPAEAMQLVEGRDVDAIVSDLSLPGMNGVELVRRLARMMGPRPVVLISGMADDATIDALGEVASSVRFLAKPMSPQSLIASVADALVSEAKSLPGQTALGPSGSTAPHV